MLSLEEVDLVRRETAIPGLVVVLDPDAFIDVLRRAAPAIDPRAARITRLRYDPGRYCQVAYRIRRGDDGAELDVGARACRPADLAPCLGYEASSASSLQETGRMILEECAVMLTSVYNDAVLPQLRGLTDASRREHVLRELLPDRPNLWRSECRCIRYKPERRCVFELIAQDGARAVLKCYPQDAYGRGKCNANAFVSDGLLRIATPLGCVDRLHLIACEWLPGRLLTDVFSARDFDCEAVAVTGGALAALHAQRPAGLAHWAREAEVQALISVSWELGFICPRLARHAEELAARLASQLKEPGVRRAVHGDFSANQVLVDGQRRAAIIDLDSARYGDPSDDLGNIIAQVERAGLRGDLPPGRVERLIEALLAGYLCSTQHPLPEQIGLWTALQLFRRARFPFRAREPDWPRRTEALLERAAVILDAASHGYGKRQDGI
ncbi:phosphotransferase family protein [Burkholderia ubonensis]|uniref:phosphotransferase family protein n=1 Tax=Burkholderia ubonensis TaxID=101571 RepID=UPI0009B4AF21|nr:phosphotransferase [Burkholderia ubonensis]